MSADKRIQWLHKYIVNMRYPNASRLAERFGISHRQAQRDVTSLREDYGAPLAYSADHRGFYYTEEFSLPTYNTSISDFDYVEAVMGETPNKATQEALQLQIPYSAVIRCKDKLALVEFRRMIVGDEGKHRYRCEFHSVDVFLSLILSSEADITILSPDWLRSRLISAAQRILKNNPPDENNT